MNIPPKYEDVVAQLEAANELAYRCIDSADRNHLRAVNSEQREAALREELASLRETNRLFAIAHEDSRKHVIKIEQRLTVAEQRAEMLEREFKKLRDVAHGCYQIASSYSGCIDGVEESGGDDHDDPSCAIFHRLYYAMFDADAALKPAEEGEGS